MNGASSHGQTENRDESRVPSAATSGETLDRNEGASDEQSNAPMARLSTPSS
jgi:hypothetical protein